MFGSVGVVLTAIVFINTLINIFGNANVIFVGTFGI